MNLIKVAKFGGTSLADANQINKVIDIVRSDPRRKYVVVSAPGKRNKSDHKITDLLYGLRYQVSGLSMSKSEILEVISGRFRDIVQDLGLKLDISSALEVIRVGATGFGNLDFLVSRGEYLCGIILAEALGYEFVDASRIIKFNSDEQYDPEATEKCKGLLFGKAKGYVIPGFYGQLPDGRFKTFSRGGSDLTGAIIASLIGADLYENWTDVSGLLMANPEVVPKAKTIKVVTYKELRELSYMGARVLHDEVIFPLRRAGIPINLRNTNLPNDDGTMIVSDTKIPHRVNGEMVGIAGRKGFTSIKVEKTLMNQEVGFIRRLTLVFEENSVNIEHLPGGIDTLSVVVSSDSLNGKLDVVTAEIERVCKPDQIVVNSDIALICFVGRAIAYAPGIASRIFTAVYSAGINVLLIDQGASEISIIFGVKEKDYETAIRAIYDEFVK